MGRWTGKSCRLITMMAMTFSFFLIEIIVGYVTNSIALVADSFHMLSDVVALCVGLASVKVSKWETKRNTFGWQRAEVLGALINAVFLMALCFSIVVESMKRLIQLEKVDNPVMMLVVGGLGLLVNIIGLCLFGGHVHSHGGSHGHSHGSGGEGHSHDGKHQGHCHSGKHEGNGHCHDNSEIPKIKVGYNGYCNDRKESLVGETKCLVIPEANSLTSSTTTTTTTISISTTDENHCKDKEIYTIGDAIEVEVDKSASLVSLNMKGVFLHVLGDALGSVVVVISGLAIWLVDGSWKYYLDPVLSLQIVGIIFFTTVPLFKETALILLQGVPPDVSIDDITGELLEIEDVTGVHECHIWRLCGSRIVGSAHIHCKNMANYMDIASQIKSVFHRAGVHSTTIQPEFFNGEADIGTVNFRCLLQCPEVGGRSCVEDTCCSFR